VRFGTVINLRTESNEEEEEVVRLENNLLTEFVTDWSISGFRVRVGGEGVRGVAVERAREEETRA